MSEASTDAAAAPDRPARWQRAEGEPSQLDALWNGPLERVDVPNLDRGGWSEVGRLEVGGRELFLKRQSDHLTRSLRHPLGEPTFAREYRAIQRLEQAGIATVEVVFFGLRRQGRARQALLATRALEGYRSLEEWLGDWDLLPEDRQHRLIRAAARLVRRLHDAGWIHNSLYPKHLFLRCDGAGEPARLIDLETARRSWRGWRDRVRDLETLHRRSGPPSQAQRCLFLEHYLQPDLGEHRDRLAQAILRRSARRR